MQVVAIEMARGSGYFAGVWWRWIGLMGDDEGFGEEKIRAFAIVRRARQKACFECLKQSWISLLDATQSKNHCDSSCKDPGGRHFLRGLGRLSLSLIDRGRVNTPRGRNDDFTRSSAGVNGSILPV